ncbi:MAG: RimJ/RimL family protein N-acetyltransferase [Acidimicrobiales bacterium]|jgi:RimJ/RimL family protein N-acetyltransferase
MEALASAQPEGAGNAPTCDVCDPPLALDDHRTLTIRHASPDDREALAGLYQRMSTADLHRRFFSGGQPLDSFLDRWIDLEGHGGLCLVAELNEDGPLLVGDAGFSPQADGDVELGIAIDPDYRGWLGAWLLDSVFRHAQAWGIPNIQALILADNRAMMALAKRRGFVVLDHPDFSKVRLTMSTDGHVPSWPKKKLHPRVVIETNRTRWRGESQLREAGFDVAICPGSCTAAGHCPVLDDEHCPLLDGADAVIVDLPPDDPFTDELLAADRLIHPGLRLLVGSTTNPDGTRHRVATNELLDALVDLGGERDNHGV